MFDPKVAEKARQSGYHVSCGFQGCKEFIDATWDASSDGGMHDAGM